MSLRPTPCTDPEPQFRSLVLTRSHCQELSSVASPRIFASGTWAKLVNPRELCSLPAHDGFPVSVHQADHNRLIEQTILDRSKMKKLHIYIYTLTHLSTYIGHTDVYTQVHLYLNAFIGAGGGHMCMYVCVPCRCTCTHARASSLCKGHSVTNILYMPACAHATSCNDSAFISGNP